MKKILALILSLTVAHSLCVPAFAAETAPNETYTITVNDQILDISALPLAPYKEGGTVMVPLRKIGETLGYKVDWSPETKAITVEDTYIQKATLFDGTAAVIFEGKLQIINMSRKIENALPTVTHNGYTYVPLEFFQEFFNDTAIDGTAITIAPSKSELHNNIK